MRDLALTLAGGGNRAFYQFGLLERWHAALLPRTAAIVACSAGASVAVMFLSGREPEARAVWEVRTRGVTKNVDFTRALRGERIAPHGEVFREIMLTLGRDGGLERVRALPVPFLVLASAFPRALPAPVAVVVGISAYQLEKALRPATLHPTFGRAVGFRPAVFDARDCETPEELADLVLASSATPPFTPVGRFRHQRLLDGGMVDNAPAFVADTLPGVRRTLVLLTRPYPPGVLGPRGRRMYVAPRVPVPIERWDYTRPHLLQDTIEQGRREADAHWPAVEAWLDADIGADPGVPSDD